MMWCKRMRGRRGARRAARARGDPAPAERTEDAGVAPRYRQGDRVYV